MRNPPANAVGYQKKSVAEMGLWTMGSGFLTTGTTTDSFGIQSLLPLYPPEAEEPLYDYEAQIQELLPNGKIGPIHYYLCPGSDAKGFEGQGWYTRDDKTATYTKSNKTFVRGEGFLYSSPEPYIDDPVEGEILPPSYLQSSGEVNLKAKTIEVAEMGLWVMCPDRPTALNIQKIIPSYPPEAEEPLYDYEAQIQELLPNGKIGPIHYYLCPGSDAKGFEGQGWYTRDDKTATYTKSTKVFEASEGFLYSSPEPYIDDPVQGEILPPSYLTFQE